MLRQVKKWSPSEKKILEALLKRNLSQSEETQEIAKLTEVLNRSYLSINSKLWDMRKKIEKNIVENNAQPEYTYSYNEQEKTITIVIKLK